MLKQVFDIAEPAASDRHGSLVRSVMSQKAITSLLRDCPFDLVVRVNELGPADDLGDPADGCRVDSHRRLGVDEPLG